MAPIPLVDVRAEIVAIRREVDEAIARVLDSAELIGGPEVEQFELELGRALGGAEAVAVSSGSDALHVIGMALGIGPGDEVVTTPFTFFSTAASFARLGATLVFADIDAATLALAPDAALTACTSRTRAVVPVNLFVLPAELPRVPCALVEDSAQSIGAAPVRGVASALSFFPTKNLGALGDGGAVLTRQRDLADKIRLLRTHGARPKYHHQIIGGNFRLDALQAAVLRIKLRHLAARTQARRAVAATYRALFGSARIPAEVVLPPDRPEHVYHHFVLRTPERDSLRSHLRDREIATEVYYPLPLHLQPAFASLGYRKGAFPQAEAACDEVLALPMHAFLTLDSQERIVAEISRFFTAS